MLRFPRLGEENGEPVVSAIGKHPVSAAMIDIGRSNLSGGRGLAFRRGAFGRESDFHRGRQTAIRIGARFSWALRCLGLHNPLDPVAGYRLHRWRHARDSPLWLVLTCDYNRDTDRRMADAAGPGRTCTPRSPSSPPSGQELLQSHGDGRPPCRSGAWRKRLLAREN
jgi:hypothetical protein